MPITFSEEFLATYRARRDPFRSLLARAVYVTHYKRPTDLDFTDTVRRVVEANVALDPSVEREEAEALFDCIWNLRGTPPGRGWWAGGAGGVPGEALLNCYACEIRSIDDFCWATRSLMLGGGVGFSLLGIDNLPTVTKTDIPFGVSKLFIRCVQSHPDVDEVSPDARGGGPLFVVEDSREGWVEALRRVLEAAWADESLTVSVSGVRPRGAPLVTFGGSASGPAPLTALLRTVFAIVRGAAGRKLTSVEVLDICNHIGVSVVAGAKRRSAIIQIGDPADDAFRRAKHDTEALASHRYSSNNSVGFTSAEELEGCDWSKLAEDVQTWGEPGAVNLYLARKTDAHAIGVNPCYAAGTLVHTREGHFPIESLIGKTVDVWDGKSWRTVDTFAVTGRNQMMFKIRMYDGSTLRVTPSHKMVLEGVPDMVEAWHLRPGDVLEKAHVEGDTREFPPGFDTVHVIHADGEDAEVYCLVTDDPDRIALSSGLLVGRCGEQFLEHREACNLSEVYAPRCNSDTEISNAVRLLTRFSIRQRLIPMSDPIAEATRQRNMRIGVSLSGIVDARLDERPQFLSQLYCTARQAADQYADHLGVSRPITVTTVKPSGTTALMASCSPGIHARYADFSIRNVRFDKDDRIVPELVAAGVPVEPAKGSKRMVVASFVERAPAGARTNLTQTAREQLERQLTLQKTFVDNAISATITFKDSERAELPALMAEFIPLLKSTSFLPFDSHSYTQAPYIPITEAEFNARAAAINEDADLGVSASHDAAPEFGECQGGACPVR